MIGSSSSVTGTGFVSCAVPHAMTSVAKEAEAVTVATMPIMSRAHCAGSECSSGQLLTALVTNWAARSRELVTPMTDTEHFRSASLPVAVTLGSQRSMDVLMA